MRILIALGGNALLRRGEPLTAANQLANIRRAAAQIAPLACKHELVLAHGNGPQVGLLALQSAASDTAGTGAASPLDVLDAESEGMIGYLLEQELANALTVERPVVTLLTRVEVAADDPAFGYPTKPIGPVYRHDDATRLAAENGWRIAADGDGFRRVVASPKPLRIMELDPIRWLAERGTIVIAAGGGGIPVALGSDGRKHAGVEAVIDKDLASALLAHGVGADLLVIATDVDAVYAEWGTPEAHPIMQARASEFDHMMFASGSMGPKVDAACTFARSSGRSAVIGSLERIGEMVAGRAGTRVVAQ
jgi:carbamate kinase